jgi:glycolate oxidase iron-sulfur subunit
MNLSQHYDEIAHCNRCGFCQVACPIFRSTGHESGVARGRLALLRAIIEGRLPWNESLKEPLFDCLLCEACTANCFPAVPTASLVVQARSEYLDKVGRHRAHRLLFDHLLPYPRRLHLAARALAAGKNSGASNLAAALGLLRIFGKNIAQSHDILDRIPPLPLRDEIKPGLYPGLGKTLRVGYFVGCGVDILQQRTGRSTFELLSRWAETVTVLENACCGLPAWSYGDLPAARKLAEKNIDILSRDNLDVIVTDCSSCASFLKKYPTLFPDTDPRQKMAASVSNRVRDMVTVIAEMAPASGMRRKTSVTWHDPCHISRGQGISKVPREALRRIPGIDYREMPEADWCCGGAGAYALSHFELSRQVLNRKMENLKKAGAGMVVTSCPACMVQLAYGIRQHGLDVEVFHLSEVFADLC